MGSAAKEAAGELGRHAASQVASKFSAGLTKVVPGADKAAGRIGSIVGRAAFTAATAVGAAIVLIVLTVLGGSGVLTAIIGAGASQNANTSQMPAPTPEQCRAMPTGWCKVALMAQQATAGSTHPVPWTIIAGLLEVQTDFGRTSPYDTIDRYPNRPTPAYLQEHAPDLAAQPSGDGSYVEMGTGSCPVAPPPVPIGGKTATEGTGPFLLNAAAVADIGTATAADPCRAAMFTAKAIAAAADAISQEQQGAAGSPAAGTGGQEAAASLWQQAIDRADIMVSPQDTDGVCRAAPGPDGKAPTVDRMIAEIWTCELRKDKKLYVVSSPVTDGAGTVAFNTFDRADGIATLISEAQTVSWNFSQWTGENCPKPGDSKASKPAGPGKGPAGVFPLTAEQAKAAGVDDRCDAEQNIAGAARLVALTETVPPDKRPHPAGQPYLPMIGGWANLPQALGGTLASFALSGPSASWEPSDECSNNVVAYLTAAAGAGSPFAALAGATTLPADAAPYRSWLTAHGGANPASSPACAGGTEAQLSAFMTQQAAALGPDLAPSDTPAEQPGPPDSGPASDSAGAPVPPDDTPAGVDAAAMRGLSAWFALQAVDVAAPPRASWGTDSVVPRLITLPTVIDQGPRTDTPAAPPATAWQQKVTDWAVSYGGVTAPFTPVGTRTGSLLVNSGNLAVTATSWASASQQAQIVIDAAKSWLGTPYSWGGGNTSGPTLGIDDARSSAGAHDSQVRGFDCSGLTLYAYSKIGISLPHLSRIQATMGRAVASLDDAQPGDLIFFYSPVTHVAIYLGGGQMLEAPQSGDVVRVSRVRNHVTAIRRFVTDQPPASGPAGVRQTAGVVPAGTGFFAPGSPCPATLGNDFRKTASKANLAACASYFTFGQCPAVAKNAANVPLWISQALVQLYRSGFPQAASDAANLTLIIMHESGGDPCAINAWDSNWHDGHPSFGLMQTIPGSFEANMLPGFTARWDPVAQVIAGARYAARRYGSLSAVPGVMAVAAGRPYVGY